MYPITYMWHQVEIWLLCPQVFQQEILCRIFLKKNEICYGGTPVDITIYCGNLLSQCSSLFLDLVHSPSLPSAPPPYLSLLSLSPY